MLKQVVLLFLFMGQCYADTNYVGKPIHKIQRTLESFRHEISKIHTIPDIVNFQKKFHRYEADSGHPFSDDPKSPFRTFLDRGGDCEDFAIQAVYIARLKGYNGSVRAFFGLGWGHSYYLLQDKDTVYVLCNNLIGIGAKTKLERPAMVLIRDFWDFDIRKDVVPLYEKIMNVYILSEVEYISNEDIYENKLILKNGVEWK